MHISATVVGIIDIHIYKQSSVLNLQQSINEEACASKIANTYSEILSAWMCINLLFKPWCINLKEQCIYERVSNAQTTVNAVDLVENSGITAYKVENKFQWTLNQNRTIFGRWNTFQNVVCRMAVFLCRPKGVKYLTGALQWGQSCIYQSFTFLSWFFFVL